MVMLSHDQLETGRLGSKCFFELQKRKTEGMNIKQRIETRLNLLEEHWDKFKDRIKNEKN